MRTFAAAFAAILLAIPAIAAEPGPIEPERLALAREYADLTYLKQITQETTIKQIRMGWSAANICTDDPCRKALDKSVTDSVSVAYADYEFDIVRLMARRLTRDQLTAAIDFARTPAGQAIATMNKDMTGDFAEINNAFSQNVAQSVFRAFCTQQPEACRRAMAGATARPARK